MPEDDDVIPQEAIEPVEPQDPAEPIEPVEPIEQEVDYRGKLNATHGFLKKEGYEFKEGKWVRPANAPETTVPQATGSISLADSHALIKADVHEDDIERVERFAKLEGVSIKEALKNPELKAILGVRGEQRTTALAANVTNVRRGPSKATSETLLDNANAGKLPEDDADIERLIAARSQKK